MEQAIAPPLPIRDYQYQTPSIPGSSDYAWRTFVFVTFGLLIAVGVAWLAYTLFLKDLILVCKAKKQRRTEEIGYGNTPARLNGDQQGLPR
ncbi:movement protein [Wheat dwarf virus - [Henan zhengzhou]]|uniref:Movement protein n=14 Tax=Wheat dwarf virus TaxID=10834 RepID=MP_WDVS|nr:RecName: Full=Movement protein; Short=MP [Wheat dwarf virus - [Sweden]]ABI26180.1 Movement protein [Wheat dwarf virus - [Taiyuan]]ABS10869.1 movement protein [Wheat dwarf virus - [Gansu Gangu]]ABS10877.1 movement protein [Wheat dwarf virus - [Henan zhengzhou]]ABS10885.1 movement protein [Wheat dwarf virus - [Hebei Shijiazhuang]]ABS10921.1 movement protein [Wheat dwarf virus - [Sanxi Taiyuan]]ABS10933.1 movement protein [Wheat dwarf virus - [Sanxi Yuncheng]]ABS10945.1 movement protein [Whe